MIVNLTLNVRPHTHNLQQEDNLEMKKLNNKTLEILKEIAKENHSDDVPFSLFVKDYPELGYKSFSELKKDILSGNLILERSKFSQENVDF